MSIFGRAWRAIRGGAPTETKGESLTAHPFYAFAGLRPADWTPRRYSALADEGFCKNSIAHRCVDEIAKGVSQAPILLYRVDADGFKREARPDHPVSKLLRRPNPRQSRVEFTYMLAAHLAIGGNAYIEGIGPTGGRNAGKYRELWLKRPDRMTVMPRGTDVASYRYDHGAESVSWPVDPVTLRCALRQVKLFNPLDDHYGLSPISVAAADVDTHNKTREWNKSLLDNAARPEGALVTPNVLTDLQHSRLKAEIREDYSGAANAGKPLLLENGLTWQQLSFSPRDLDFLNARMVSARDICAAFGVPPMLLGIPGDNTYSNYQEARLAFHDETVSYYLQAIVSALESWIVPGEDEAMQLGWDADAVPAMAYRRAQLFERAERASFLSLDEKRDMAGFGALPESKGDVVLVPSTVRPLDQALEPPAPAPGLGVAPDAPGGDAKPPPKPKKPAANDDADADADPPKRAANDKATGPALIATLKAAREELGGSETAFALWLAGEGLSEDEAAALAKLTVRAGA